MKKTIAIGSLIIVLALVLVGIYWFKRGDACLAQPPFYNCRVQDKFDAIDAALSGLSSQTGSEPEVIHIGAHADIFSFEHIAGDGGVGWTRIMRNGGIKDSLGFYTNDIDPVLTPLSEDTLIGSAWQWPQDSKLYNGPFFNYYLDFRSRQTTEFPTKGKLVAASPNGAAAVFLESECDKNPPSMEIGHNCNNQNLSLRLLGAPPKDDGVFITHYNEARLLDFNHVAFSPDGSRLAIEAEVESIDYDAANKYWALFIVDGKTGELIRRNNRLSKDRYENVQWLNNEDILYW